MNTQDQEQYEGGYGEEPANPIVVELPAIQEESCNLFEVSNHQHECGHRCNGVEGESIHLPCLEQECIEASVRAGSAQVPISCASGELCGICYTSELGEEACVRLSCGHVFHANCVLMLLQHQYSTLRITFGYLDCPQCKAEINIESNVPVLTQALNREREYK